MIEINLLPEELRKVEGTPPTRLLAILLSVVLACFLGVIIGNYIVLKIPQKQTELLNTNDLIKKLREDEKAVESDRTALTNLVQKVKALDNLSQTRILYGRLLTKFWQAVPDGVWIRNFAVTPDNLSAGNPSGGKRYVMTFGGYTMGGTDMERSNKVTGFMLKLKHEFAVAPDAPLPQPVPADFGFNTWNNARFYPPILIKMTTTTLPTPSSDIDPAVKNQLPQDKTGLDFSMTMSFELPPPVN